MAKLWQFSQGHPKPAFSEKKQRWDQEKLLKNRPESTPRFKGPRALWRKCHYPVICTHLKCKHWKTFWRKQRLQKFQNGQVMAIFARSPKTLIFWKSAKGRGTQGKFFKIRQKSSPRLKEQRALWRKWHYPLYSIHLKCKNCRRFRRKQRLQKCLNGQIMAIFCKVTQNQHFLKKCKGEAKRNFSKIAQKVDSFERPQSTLAQMALSSN